MRMLPTPPVCPSCGSTTTAIPGPKGDTGDAGPAGAKGDKGDTGDAGPVGGGAWTTLTEPITVPAELGLVDVYVDDTSWMEVNMVLAARSPGAVTNPSVYFFVNSVIDGFTVRLYNPAQTSFSPYAYETNPPPGSIIAAGSKLVSAGVQGATGDPASSGWNSLGFVFNQNYIGFPFSTNLNALSSGFLFTTQGVSEATISTVATIPIAKGGTGQTAKTAAFNALAPLTTKGDIIYHDGTNCQRLAIGSAGQQLIVSSGAPAWGNVFPAITTFRSSEIAIPSSGVAITAIPHGLAGIPLSTDMYFKCIDAGGDQGYALGDTVPLAATNCGTGGASIPSGALYATSTHIKFTFASNGSAGLTFCKPTDGTSINPVTAKWKMVFTAIYA